MERKKIANILFYIALTIELFFMVVEKSEISIPFISHIFRVTFLITAAAVIVMERSKKEWVVLLVIVVFAFFCYRMTGRNELLRFSMFIFSARDINQSQAEKYWFFFSLTGFAIIALLSILGVMGNIYVDADFGRGGIERRYTFGFGHPNTLCGCVYVILLLWLWLYGKRACVVSYLLWIAGSVALYKLSASRTIILIFIITIAFAMLIRFVPEFKDKKVVYALSGLVSPVICVIMSVIAAITSKYRWRVEEGDWFFEGNHFIAQLDKLLNGRVANLYYDSETHEGAIETWRLFSNRTSDRIFDMGWVRLYYWYGIIPATLIVLLTIYVIYLCWKNKDAWTVLLIFSLCIYTVIEATFVSRYIGRNFMLPIVAVYVGQVLKNRITTNFV